MDKMKRCLGSSPPWILLNKKSSTTSLTFKKTSKNHCYHCCINNLATVSKLTKQKRANGHVFRIEMFRKGAVTSDTRGFDTGSRHDFIFMNEKNQTGAAACFFAVLLVTYDLLLVVGS